MATDVADSTAAASAETVTTELAVTGMTCGTCAARIQRKLGRLPGVEASVNYATGRARVTHPPEQDTDELVAAVRTLGFGATAAQPLVPAGGGVPAPRTAPESAARPTATSTTAARGVEDAPDPELSELRHRALVCLALTLPVMAVAMNPDWQFRYWQWFCLVLTAPVVIWGGYRFHRAAARHLRHLSATMDTLVSVGTLAAFGWSLWTLFFGGAGLGGMRHALYLIPTARPVRRLADGVSGGRGRHHHRGAAGALDRAPRTTPRARGVVVAHGAARHRGPGGRG